MFYRATLYLVFSLLWVSATFSQTPRAGDGRSSVALVAISAPDRLSVGVVGHFRVQVSETTRRPVNYLWDLGDGTLSMGSPVSHAYAAPGEYTVTVIGRNGDGQDTLRAAVTVVDSVIAPVDSTPERARRVTNEDSTPTVGDTPREQAASPRPVSRSALYGSGGVKSFGGGYTWVVSSDLWEERARNQMLLYRLRGFRADVITDSTGKGNPAYRIVVGQFPTVDQARAVRPWLPPTGGSWLMNLRDRATDAHTP